MEIKRLPARFYRSDSGREPVREWLKSLDLADRKAIGEDTKDVELSWPIGMPLIRSLGHSLWEVRSGLAHLRIARVLFCVVGEDAEDAEAGHRLSIEANERTRPAMKKKNIGSSFDSWLREEGIHEEVSSTAIKRVLARQVEAAMEEQQVSKAEMAKRMQTSRAALNRLLDPNHDAVTLSTLQRAAAALGREIRLELV